MVDIKKLLEYNTRQRHAFFNTLSTMPWEEFAENREASFNSIKNIFIHTLNAIDYWLDFLQSQNLHSTKKFDEYTTFEEIKTYMDQVEERMQKYLNPLTPEKLSEKYRPRTNEVTAEDILVHVFEEEVHHRGELIALLWQMGIEPPVKGYPA